MYILGKPSIRQYLLYRCLLEHSIPPSAGRSDQLNLWICELESKSARVNDHLSQQGQTEPETGKAYNLSISKRDIVYFILNNTTMEGEVFDNPTPGDPQWVAKQEFKTEELQEIYNTMLEAVRSTDD